MSRAFFHLITLALVVTLGGATPGCRRTAPPASSKGSATGMPRSMGSAPAAKPTRVAARRGAARTAPTPPRPRQPPALRAPDGTVMQPCGSVPKNMACVPGGPFLRGTDDGPPNTRPRATIWVQTFYMDRYEATTSEYQACVRAGRCRRAGPRYQDYDRPRQPIVGINWHDAVRFCQVHGKHLPTEAEWEKAARGTRGNLYPWGNDPVTCARAIIMDKSGRSCGVKKRGDLPHTGRTFEVGSRPPGIYGLYDMVGNSWEWVWDWYSPSYARCGKDCEGVNPRGPCQGKARCPGHRMKLVRGGSWYWPARYNTAVWRRPHYPSNQPFHHFGFRCAASLAEARALVQAAPKAPAPSAPAPDGKTVKGGT